MSFESSNREIEREREREGEIAQSYYVWHFYLEYMNKIIIFLFMTVSMIISFLILNKFHCKFDAKSFFDNS